MKRNLILLLTAALLMIPGAYVKVSVAEIDPPFRPGEKLTFELKWGFIPAGEAVLRVFPMETVQGIRSYHFVVEARTNDFIDSIYKVRDRIDAYADERMTRSLRYQKKQREGKHKRNVVVNFDWNRKEVQYVNAGNPRKPVSVPEGTFDPLSVFYAFRLQELKEGTEFKAPVTDGKKYVVGNAEILKREKIKVSGKEYDTYLVEPEMEKVEGIFEKSKNARLQIWVTTDHRHIPVKIRSKVVVGSFTGELVSIENEN